MMMMVMIVVMIIMMTSTNAFASPSPSLLLTPDLMNAFEVSEKSDTKGHILCCATLTEKKAFTTAIRKLLKEYQDLAFRKEQLTKVGKMMMKMMRKRKRRM